MKKIMNTEMENMLIGACVGALSMVPVTAKLMNKLRDEYLYEIETIGKRNKLKEEYYMDKIDEIEEKMRTIKYHQEFKAGAESKEEEIAERIYDAVEKKIMQKEEDITTNPVK